ncbi:MAG: DUF4382 domain-containing protein [Chloroflexi bacterium]|nr:DUF4382 domain-containing protein [Chloroflexota bacterium]
MSENMNRILDECIDRLNSGASVEECLGLYPEYAEELEPLLRAISELHAESALVPSTSAKISGRQQLLQERARLAAERDKPRVSFFQNMFAQPKLWAPVAAALVVILLGFGLSTIFMTGNDDQTTVVDVPPETPQSSPTSIPTISPDASPTASPDTSPTASPTPSPGTSPITPSVTPEITPTTSEEPAVIASVGILEFRVTDAPADLAAVHVTINNIEVHQAGPEDEETGWKTVVSGTRSFELLELRGVEAILGSAEIESGHYTQIRMEVESCTVTMIDGETHTAEVPSGKLKIVGFGSFNVEPGKTTVVTLDIDAEESVRVTGTGQVKFKPTVKVLVGGLKQKEEKQQNEPPKNGNTYEGSQEANLSTNSPSRKGSLPLNY